MPFPFDFGGENFYLAPGPSYAGMFDYDKAVSAAIPEPANRAMLIAGFGLAGGALRRQRWTTVAGASA